MSAETAYDRLLAKLEGSGRRVKPSRDGQAMAQCPAHDDGAPSLSVTRIEGQCLVYCHAGCATDDVVAALGMTMGELFDESSGASYRYTDQAGTVLRTVTRTPDKRFRQAGQTKGPSTLYRLPRVVEAVGADQTVYVVEGEKDVHALESVGAVATTAPMGAANWGKVDSSPLHGGKVVVIVDDDDAGRKWAAQVHESLDGMVQSLRLCQAKVGKDAADHIGAGYGLHELRPLELAPAGSTPGLLDGLRTGDWLDAQRFPPVRWVVPGLIPEGMSLLVGGPKIGKSWLSLDVALAVASGGRALGAVEVGAPRPVLLLALEDGDRRLQERARKLLGDAPIPSLLAYMTRIEPGMLLPTIVAWLDTLAPEVEPLVILDTLGKVMPPSAPGESAYQRDYRVAGRLKHVCDDRAGMALLVLHHDRKATSDDFVEGVSGTNGIAGAADTITMLTRARTEASGLLKVTGRDVAEREYEVTARDGVWTLAGGGLTQAATAAVATRQSATLGDRSSEIVRYCAHHAEGVRAADVAAELDMPVDDARRYLTRLVAAGRLRRPARGIYTPVLSVPSVLFEGEDSLEQDTQDRQDTGLGGHSTCSDCGADLDAASVLVGSSTCSDCERGDAR